MSDTFPTTPWVWKNGDFIRWDEATLHVLSHVVHYGSSVFEGIRCYSTPDGPSVFRLADHMRRLQDSCRVYRMEPPYAAEALADICVELVSRNAVAACYIRPIVLRGFGAPGILPSRSPVDTYVLCWPWGTYLGEGALESGVDVCVSSWARPAPNTFPAMAKAGGNYLNAQLMKMEAVENGFAEAIALDTRGLVSEGTGQNLFAVRDGALVTPAPDGSMLPGITRDCVITLAREMGLSVREEAVPREFLYMADELFFTGTAAEVTPIRSVDRRTVGNGVPGPITRRIQDRLFAVARGQAPDRHGWRRLVTAPASVGAA